MYRNSFMVANGTEQIQWMYGENIKVFTTAVWSLNRIIRIKSQRSLEMRRYLALEIYTYKVI